MFTSFERKIFNEVLLYFFDVSGIEYKDYVGMLAEIKVGKTDRQNTEYNFWLLMRCLETLDAYGLNGLQMCIENKDSVRELIIGEQSSIEGEYYTPEIWAKNGRSYLESIIDGNLSDYNIWDNSCGSGNLMRTANHPADKLFLSTLLDEDVKLVSAQFPDVTVFQLNALNGIDYDENNAMFLKQLPEKLQKVFLEDQPLIIFINPPYGAYFHEATDIQYHMKQSGMSTESKDLQHQFIYRVCLLAQTYKLSKFYLGLYSTPTWLSSATCKNLSALVQSMFEYKKGFIFALNNFSDTADSIPTACMFTAWHKTGMQNPNKIILDVSTFTDNSEIAITGSQLVRLPAERMIDWVQSKDVLHYANCPAQTTGVAFRDKLNKEPEGITLAHINIGNMAKKSMRVSSVLRWPTSTTDSVPVTPENFWRAVVAYGISSTFADCLDFSKGSLVVQAPDESINGYANLQADCLAAFLFNTTVHSYSYRGINLHNKLWTSNNFLFPISLQDCKALITDPVLIEDMEKYPCNNEIVVKALEWALPLMSEEAKALTQFSVQWIVETLQGTVRADAGYPGGEFSTAAYDAGLMQIWSAGLCSSPAREETYRRLCSALRSRIWQQVTLFGVLDGEEVFA